jgi:O-antigen/teichoic acid export membrane protein
VTATISPRFFRHIAVTGVVSQLLSLKGLVLVSVIAKSLGAVGFGIWTQSVVLAGFLTPIGALSLDAVLVRFLPAMQRDDRRRVLGASLFVVLVCSSLLGALIWSLSEPLARLVYGGDSTELVLAVRTVSVATPPSAILMTLLGHFMGTQDVRTYGSLVLLREALELGAVFVAILLDGSIVTILYFWAVGRFVAAGIALVVAQARGGAGVPVEVEWPPLFQYALPLMGVHPIVWLTKYVDRLVIATLLGTRAIGVYAAATFLANLPSLLIEPLSQVLPAWVARATDEERPADAHQYMVASLGGYLMLALPAVVGVSLLAEPILALLTDAEIARMGAPVVPIAGAAFLFYGAHAIVAEQIKAWKKTSTVFKLWALNLPITVFLAWILTPVLGLRGAAIALLAGHTTLCVLIFRITGAFRWLGFSRRHVLAVVAALAGMTAIVYLTANVFGIVLPMVIVCGAVTYAGLLSWLMADERRVIWNALKLRLAG